MDEAIATARNIGVDAVDAAKAAATGSLQGAEEIGEAAVHTVTDTLSAAVNGVRVVIRGQEVEAKPE